MQETSLDRYFNQLKKKNKIQGMTPEETVQRFSAYHRLGQQIDDPKTPDDTRKRLIAERDRHVDRIVTSCLPYVLKLAKDYARGHDDPDLLAELVAEGNHGLCRAVPKYDYTLSVPFHTYAAMWIKAMFNVALKNYRKVVRSPDNSALTVYMDAHPADRSAYLEDTTSLDACNEIELDDDAPVKFVQKVVGQLSPMKQVVFRLRQGLAGKSPAQYTSLSKAMACSNTTWCKQLYSEAQEEISSKIRSFSETSDTSWDSSDLQ